MTKGYNLCHTEKMDQGLFSQAAAAVFLQTVLPD